MSPLAETMTVLQARAWLRDRLVEGAPCPVCSQRAQVYLRRIYSSTARVLIRMHREAGQDYVFVPGFNLPGGDYGKAKFWGLIERRNHERADGSKRNGWWRLTPRGTAFVRDQLRVPRTALIYDDRILRFEDPADTVSIQDCLGVEFNYRELMGHSAP